VEIETLYDLVSGLCDELDLGNQIGTHIPSASEGILCKTLIIEGLGFLERRRYMVSSFFESKPTELLLEEGIQSMTRSCPAQ